MRNRSFIGQKSGHRLLDSIVRRLRPAWIRAGIGTFVSGYERFAPMNWIDLPPGRRLCVIAPHPDDESIGCAGLMARWSAAGRGAEVVFLTAGENGNRALRDPALPAAARAALQAETAGIRKAEAQRALAVLGAQSVWLDGTDGALFQDETGLAQQLAGLWSDTPPDLIATPFPADRHRDHAVAARIVAAAAHQSLPGKTPVLAYEVWSPAPANALLDIADIAEMKWQAIRAYQSQTATTDYLSATRALNTYRAISGGRDGAVAEAFYQTDMRSYADMALALKV